jgi:hypothetical protein
MDLNIITQKVIKDKVNTKLVNILRFQLSNAGK